jgi:AcrR family transcriptional regulator
VPSDRPTARRSPGSTLDRGRATRTRILEATAQLCLERGGAELSVADIAAAAGVFPNQVTYHFGAKDALLVEAAFLALLHDAERIEAIGPRSPDAASYRRAIARAVLALPSLPSITRALAAAISKPELAGVVNTHLQLLFRQSERHANRLIATRGWTVDRPMAVEVRTFWSTALGAVLLARAGVNGTASDLDLAGTLTIHD